MNFVPYEDYLEGPPKSYTMDPNDVLDFQPIIPTRAIVVTSAQDKQTDAVIMIAEIGPLEAGPPMHVHPYQHESFQVMEGEAEFILGDQEIILKKGDRIDIPANTPHTFRNTSTTWLRMEDTHMPALSFEEMMRELHHLVRQRKIKGFKDINSLIYLSMLWLKHKDLQRSIKPPFFIMKSMATLGKMIGFRI